MFYHSLNLGCRDIFKKNDMSIAFLQQILNGRLLLVVIIEEKKSNFSVRFKFELITTNYR